REVVACCCDTDIRQSSPPSSIQSSKYAWKYGCRLSARSLPKESRLRVIWSRSWSNLKPREGNGMKAIKHAERGLALFAGGVFDGIQLINRFKPNPSFT